MSDEQKNDRPGDELDPSKRPNLEDAIRQVAEEDRRTLGRHPDPIRLLDYHEGKLLPRETEAVKDHLALCHSCARAVLDFAAFPDLDPPGESQPMSAADLERERRRFQATVEMERRSDWKHSPIWLPLAAALLIAAVALAMWNSELWSRTKKRSGPRGDVVMVSVAPEGQTALRGGEPVSVPSWASEVILSLAAPPDDQGYRWYEVDARSDAGGRIVSGLRLESRPGQPFLFTVPSEDLLPGGYRIELRGLNPGEERVLATYRVIIAEDR